MIHIYNIKKSDLSFSIKLQKINYLCAKNLRSSATIELRYMDGHLSKLTFKHSLSKSHTGHHSSQSNVHWSSIVSTIFVSTINIKIRVGEFK